MTAEASQLDGESLASEPAQTGRVKRNVVANFAGRFWVAFLGFAFVPLYIKFLGMEAYGLIGFYTTLQTVFFLLDMGLSTTLNRELARRSVRKDAAQEMRDLSRTLEAVYWAAAIVMGCAIVALSSVIAGRWVRAEELSPEVIRQAVAAMGIALALQFPFSLYQGGLLGLQRQVLLNVILIVMSTFRFGGVVIVLWQFSPTLHAYFGWQVLASGLQSGVTAVLFWRSLPAAARPVFRKSILTDVWRFAAGMAGITAFAVLLTQMDKVVLSKLLSLASFGYYALAALVAGSLAVISYPLFTALFPRFTQLVAVGDESALTRLYHKASQLMTVAVVPLAAVIAMFSHDVLLAWTGKPGVADHAHLLLSLLIIGYALNGLVTVPYALQLAYGWTKLGLYINMVGVIVLVPGVWLSARQFGAPGAAAVWIVLNACYVLVNVQVMHRRLLKKEMGAWYLRDVAVPAVAAVAFAAVARWLAPEGLSRLTAAAVVIVAIVISAMASSLTAPHVRDWILGRIGAREAGSQT